MRTVEPWKTATELTKEILQTVLPKRFNSTLVVERVSRDFLWKISFIHKKHLTVWLQRTKILGCIRLARWSSGLKLLERGEFGRTTRSGIPDCQDAMTRTKQCSTEFIIDDVAKTPPVMAQIRSIICTTVLSSQKLSNIRKSSIHKNYSLMLKWLKSSKNYIKMRLLSVMSFDYLRAEKYSEFF